MRVLLVLAITVPLFLVAVYVIRAQVGVRRQELAPTRDLATAVRLLDRCAEADEVMAYLPSDTREEVATFLRGYHGRALNQ